MACSPNGGPNGSYGQLTRILNILARAASAAAAACTGRPAALLLFLCVIFSPAPSTAQVTCNVTFTNIAFNNIDVLPGTAIDSAGTLTTTCTGLTGANKVILCYGMDDGSFALVGGVRQLGSGANRLGFNVYSDAARTVTWNSTAAGKVPVVLTATVATVTSTVYARILGSQQSAALGAYSTTMSSPIFGSLFTGATPACSTQTTQLGTRTYTISATVVSSCMVTTTTLNFGTTSLFLANIDQTSTISVTCTNTTAYQVRIDGGVAAATDPTLRKMSLGANKITYGLYRDAARGAPWGSTDGTNTQPGTGNAAAIGHTVYGRIPPQASQPPGVYTDTVVVTVSFI